MLKISIEFISAMPASATLDFLVLCELLGI